MRSYFLIIATTPGLFFFSAWLLMIFTGIVANDLGINTISYTTSMVFTIGLWLGTAPLVGSATRWSSRRRWRLI